MNTQICSINCIQILFIAHISQQCTELPCDYASVLERTRDTYINSYIDWFQYESTMRYYHSIHMADELLFTRERIKYGISQAIDKMRRERRKNLDKYRKMRREQGKKLNKDGEKEIRENRALMFIIFAVICWYMLVRAIYLLY